jgi:hypothetical protein
MMGMASTFLDIGAVARILVPVSHPFAQTCGGLWKGLTIGLKTLCPATWWSTPAPACRARYPHIRGPRASWTSFTSCSQRQALARLVENGPIPAIHGVVRWRRADLAQWIFQEYRISLDVSTVGRELRTLGFVKLSARPRHHGQNEFAVDDFKKTSPTTWRRSRQSCPTARR